MTSDAPIQADPYLSSKEAGKLLGYTHDYISKLCREGKMVGIQRGRVWFVTEAEVRAFQLRHEAELEQKKAELSQKFSAIRMEHESMRSQDAPVRAATTVEPPAEIFSVSMPVSESEETVPAQIIEPVRSSVESEPGQAVHEEAEGDYADAPVQKTIQFAMPKHFAAVAVLAFLVFAPSIVSDIQAGTKGTALTQSVQSVPAADIVEHLDEGITAVVTAQAELVSQTANTFSFLQYLSDGYWELAMSMTQLCRDFYGFLNVVSNGYLAVYVLHGQILYDSFGKIDNMGAVVLQGYELVGESFVVGSQNVANMFKDFFMVDSYVSSLKKN